MEVHVEKLVSKLQHTGHHLIKQRDLFFSRTKRAGAALVEETRDAGRDLVESVTLEAKSWQRYVSLRASRFGGDVIATITPRSLEKRVLAGVGGALRSIDARVRVRLANIQKAPAKRARKANGVAKPAARKSSSRVVASKGTGAAAIAGAARH